MDEYIELSKWLDQQPAKRVFMIGGNHDPFHDNRQILTTVFPSCIHLLDEPYSYKGCTFWGTPWTRNFHGQNPKAKCFGLDTEKELSKKFDLIALDTDVLISHCPPAGILDRVNGYSTGSTALKRAIKRVKPLIHVFGHIHEHGCQTLDKDGVLYINASYVNDRYLPHSKIISLELEDKDIVKKE